MKRTKFLLNLAQQNKTAHVSDAVTVRVANNTHDSTLSTPSKSFSTGDAESIKDAISSGTSGSEYIPPSESTNSSTILSTNSLVIPRLEKIIVTEEQLETKVLNYLKTLKRDPVININDSGDKDLPLNENQPISIYKKQFNIAENTILNTPEKNQEYIRKPSARERPTICPICFKDVITHFPRHLFRHHKEHKDIILLKNLKPKSKERTALIASLRKQGYFHLKNEKNVLNPVRNSNNKNVEHFVCTHCLGYYSKKLLSKHVKICKNKPDNIKNSRQNCLTTSQTFMASIISKNHEFLKNSRIKKEVFSIMRPDNISAVAKSDPLICLYGENLLNKHKRKQIRNLISNKMREMGRLLISLKSFLNDIHGLFDALKPEYFSFFILAAKDISGYDSDAKTFNSPSLALHMGTNLKMICDVASKIVIEKKKIPNIKWLNNSEKKNEIKELRKLIDHHWCTELSSLALKDLKEKQWNNPTQLPLTSELKTFYKYLNTSADHAFIKLNNSKEDIRGNYKILTECVLALTCGTKNPKLLTTTKFRKHIATTLQLMCMDDTEMEQIATFMGHTKKTHQEFYRLPQDIFQTAKVAKVLLLLEKGMGEKFKGKSINDIHLEKDIYYSSESDNEVDDSEPLSERVLRRAATSIKDNEQDKISEDIRDNKQDIIINEDIRDNEKDKIYEDIRDTNKEKENNILTTEMKSKNIKTNKKLIDKKIDLKNKKRHRWTEEEKKVVLKHFHSHIKKKIPPKKHECLNLISNHSFAFEELESEPAEVTSSEEPFLPQFNNFDMDTFLECDKNSSVFQEFNAEEVFKMVLEDQSKNKLQDHELSNSDGDTDNSPSAVVTTENEITFETASICGIVYLEFGDSALLQLMVVGGIAVRSCLLLTSPVGNFYVHSTT
ncbi:hypothetical protein RN001_003223 [Aquatica leii]|uniref:Uncharacterized protein n=1 Tax=Aquatica leii TaxID=1421715 RepID=A0AAN7SKM0_9COLE|nr:hypothetical protein RN001_003223 [Aquatica leii]